MLKKGLSLLIVMMLAMTMVVAPVSAATFTDTVGLRCEEAAETLAALGIVEGVEEGLFAPDKTLTRAELSAILVRIYGTLSGGVETFKDVRPLHWAYKEISTLYQMGLIQGVGDGYFAPDANVTLPQAVKMVVAMMGYAPQAEANGGYPAGYLVVASTKGLLDGVNKEATDITRGDMAVLVNNALEVPLFEKETYGYDTGVYVESKDTLLSKYMNVEIMEGVINTDYFTTIIDGGSLVRKDEVKIEATVFNKGESGASDYIGREVKAYYTVEDGASIPTLLRVVAKKADLNITVASGDIVDSTTTDLFVYEDGKNEKEIEIDGSATVIWNGKAIEAGTWTKADLMPALGTVTLISEKSAVAETIIVKSYENAVVDGKNISDKIVYLKAPVYESTELVLDTADSAVRTEFVDAEGNEVEIKSLLAGDVISVAKSKDGKVVRAIKSDKYVMGKVTEVSDDKVIIDGTEYNVATGALDAPTLGQQSKYNLDAMGNIAYVDLTGGTGYKYAYLVGAEKANELSDEAQIKLFVEDGTMKVYDLASRVNINDASVARGNALDAIPKRGIFTTVDQAMRPNSTPLKIYGKTEETIRQLVKFKLNAEGQISDILTSNDVTGVSDPLQFAGDSGFNKILDLDNEKYVTVPYNNGNQRAIMKNNKGASGMAATTHVGGNLGAFMTRYLMRPTTKIFVIPKDIYDDSKYEVRASSSLKADNNGEDYINTSLYDLSENFVVGAMVWDKSLETVATGDRIWCNSYESPIATILSIAKGQNEELENTVVMKLMTFDQLEITVTAKENMKIWYRTANTNVAKDPNTSVMGKASAMNGAGTRNGLEVTVNPMDLNVGDIIQYDLSSTNELLVAQVLIRANTPGMVEASIFNGNWGYTEEDRNYMGGTGSFTAEVVRSASTGLICRTHLSNAAATVGKEVLRVYPVAGVMGMFDLKAGTYKPITYEDIVPGDIVASIWKTHNQRMLIVYRNANPNA